MRVTIFDYGAGNIHSLAKALALGGAEVRLEADPLRALATDVFVLPGVGAFEPAARQLAPARDRLRDAILGGLPTLGICLGMQLLFESSEEGRGAGLGIFEGRVTRVCASRTPQIGWNSLEVSCDPATRTASFETAYYANGFACRPVDPSVVTAWSTHETDRFPAIVRRAGAIGVQFHPEKSSAAGIAFLQAVLAEARS
jgi:imidazole glycerol-phosphate synthase subunit HisH